MTDNTDTPRTPRTLQTREQIAAVRERTLRRELPGAGVPKIAVARAWFQIGVDAVLALIDKENTVSDKRNPELLDAVLNYHGMTDEQIAAREVMPDDTIPVPRALIARVASGLIAPGMMAEARALLDPPKPSAPRLVVIDPSDWRARGDFDVLIDQAMKQPDVLTVIDEAIDRWWPEDAPEPEFYPSELKARIRAALGVKWTATTS